MISKEMLKAKIDTIDDSYLERLYGILKAYESASDKSFIRFADSKEPLDWRAFLQKYAGCLAGATIKRPDQGEYEKRERIF